MARAKQGRQWPTDTARVCQRAIVDGRPYAMQETNALTRAVHGRYGSEVREGRNVAATTFLLGLARLSPRERKIHN
eukprot:6192273-Pleurochrysis_carterae.AAC.1